MKAWTRVCLYMAAPFVHYVARGQPYRDRRPRREYASKQNAPRSSPGNRRNDRQLLNLSQLSDSLRESRLSRNETVHTTLGLMYDTASEVNELHPSGGRHATTRARAASGAHDLGTPRDVSQMCL
ncbi:hypothetical protein EVAR_80747_1 [Eumeta japonica]|uniref:Uncharacterized protein n=1 Tax=Eumeta variegata TaxID=151549 RepID=A0A4C1X8Q0_EUMVA|nr:hypothetical protein EVAR_80747_1 [Eumeta japonica]